jgi:hypothetical protein
MNSVDCLLGKMKRKRFMGSQGIYRLRNGLACCQAAFQSIIRQQKPRRMLPWQYLLIDPDFGCIGWNVSLIILATLGYGVSAMLHGFLSVLT